MFQDGIATLAKVEAAYRCEKETKETVEEHFRSRSLYHLQDILVATDDEKEENRLLPAANKLWPFLVICVKSRNPVVSYHFPKSLKYSHKTFAKSDHVISTLMYYHCF